MQKLTKQIYNNQSLKCVEEYDMIVTVNEIFILTNQSELKRS